MRLGIRDRKVLDAFTDRRAIEGQKLSTDGRTLDGHWLGGSRIAYWEGGKIHTPDRGSRAADSIQKALRGYAAPVDFADYRPSRKPYAGVMYGSRPRRDPPRRSRTREQYLASLRWNIQDAKEALKNAVDMGDWRGVDKYRRQLETLTRKLYDVETGRGESPKRARRRETWAEQIGRHERMRARFAAGRTGLP